jgi:Leucine-rich repeat (LRR) protein
MMKQNNGIVDIESPRLSTDCPSDEEQQSLPFPKDGELQAQESSPWIQQRSQLILDLVSTEDSDSNRDDDPERVEDIVANEKSNGNPNITKDTKKDDDPQPAVEDIATNEKGDGNSNITKETKKEDASTASAVSSRETAKQDGQRRVGAFPVISLRQGRRSNNRNVEHEDQQQNDQDSSPEQASGITLTAKALTHEELRDEILSEAVEATPVVYEHNEKTKYTSWKKKTNLCLLLGILAVVAVVLGAVLGTQKNRNDDTRNENPVSSNDDFETPLGDDETAPTATILAPPTPAPTLSSEQESLLVYLNSISFDQGQTLQDRSSPQYQAFVWLSQSENDGFPPFPSDKLVQKYALATFYYATGGSNWLKKVGWLEYDNVCSWYSNSPAITCGSDTSRDSILELDLPFNNLDGTIPIEMGLLSSLTNLNLQGNKLKGPLPGSLLMSSLRYITLDGNALVGSLPTEIGHLTSLLELKLQNNHMNGTLPTEFGNLENIRVFRSERCTFTGTIPTEMGKLTRLEEWGKYLLCSSALRLSFSFSLVIFQFFLDSRLAKFEGPLPEEIGNMTSLRMMDFAGWRQINGTIPDGLYDLTRLTSLQLTRIGVEGTISTLLGRLSNLRTLQIGWNNLTGTLPSEIGLLTDLAVADIWANRAMTGPIPSEVGNLRVLDAFNFRANNHTGPLPTELGTMEALASLNFEHNYFLNGPLPSEIASLQSLQVLRFGRCALSGSLPRQVGLMTHLKELQALGNGMTGTLPGTWLWSLPLLEIFGIGSRITGTLPSEVGLASNLKELYLHSNDLSGGLPTELGLLTSLKKLIVSDNQFSSTLPTELANLVLLGKSPSFP